MSKITKLIIGMICIAIMIFGIVNYFFPANGFYRTLDLAEKHNKTILIECDRLGVIETADSAYIIKANQNGEFYVLCCDIEEGVGGKKYQVIYDKGYLLQGKINETGLAGKLVWNNCPGIVFTTRTSYVKWCIVDAEFYEENSESFDECTHTFNYEFKGETLIVCCTLVER